MRDILDRFRPAGAPGAPTAAGVPADRREAVTAELEPIFAALADTIVEGEHIRRAAVSAATAEAAEALRRAQAIMARARTEANAERAAEAARLQERVATESSLITRQAATLAEQIRTRARQRTPDLVAQVVALVRAEVATPDSGTGGRGGAGGGGGTGGTGGQTGGTGGQAQTHPQAGGQAGPS